MKVKQLLERYNLKTRQSLYDRLKALGITPAKNDLGHNYATPEQIELLDELNEHLQKPGSTLANFTPVTNASKISAIAKAKSPKIASGLGFRRWLEGGKRGGRSDRHPEQLPIFQLVNKIIEMMPGFLKRETFWINSHLGSG